MAFADDFIMLGRSREGLQKNIEILEVFCDLDPGLRTQGDKGHIFYISPMKDSYTINDCHSRMIYSTLLNVD